MASPSPPRWTFAARAAYFGDQLCPFCEHRNPAGAKFCNECASPLHLKPCKVCDAVNTGSGTSCYKCGAAYPVLSRSAEPTSSLPEADPDPAWAVPADVAVEATATKSKPADSARRAGRVVTSGRLLLAAIATITIAGAAYSAYRIGAAPPGSKEVASQPVEVRQSDASAPMSAPPIAAASQAIDVRENNASTAQEAVPAAAKSTPMEPERATLQAAIATTATDKESNRGNASAPVPDPATKRASAPQRRVPVQHAAARGGTPPVARRVAAVGNGGRVAETHSALQPDARKMMKVSLAHCGGDLIARFVCDQRARQQFCQGHWGELPECASGVANEHRR